MIILVIYQIQLPQELLLQVVFLQLHGNLNVDVDGKKIDPITYKLKEKKNFKIGIVTTVPITHATPAAFYSHQNNRTNYYKIAKELVNSNFDYFANGGFNLTVSQIDEIKKELELNGYNIAENKEEITKLNKNYDKVVAINPKQKEGLTPFEMEVNKDDLKLSDFVKKGIDVLENPEGFFMMVESGMIDYASHNNDAKAVISEVTALDNAVKVALEFYNKHKDETLIIVTGDHETGGMSLGNSTSNYKLNTKILENQKISYLTLEEYLKNAKNKNYSFDEVYKYLKENFGLSTTDTSMLYITQTELNKLNASYQNSTLDKELIKLINKKAGIGWTTKDHTASPITVYSIGVGSEYFGGTYNTIELNNKLMEILKLN